MTVKPPAQTTTYRDRQQKRAEEIVSKPGQMYKLHDNRYIIRSQSTSSKVYEVVRKHFGWKCECPAYKYRGKHCKHIRAILIEYGKNIPDLIPEPVIIEQIDTRQCKYCGLYDIHKDGVRHLKKGDTQQYECNTCGKRFVQNLGFEGKQATPNDICVAVEMLFAGLSARRTAGVMKSMKVKTSSSSVARWGDEYAALMEQYVDTIQPYVGELWRTDEVYLQIRGNRKYLFAMIDADTRFWIASMVAANKGTDDVKPLYEQARRIAGKVPDTLVSDGASNFAEAHRKLYAAKNHLHKESTHVRHIHVDGDPNNNQMGSFNSHSIRAREKVTRGIKKEDSGIISGMRTYHNHMRPHMSLPNNMTPGEAAGIHVQGHNKIQTLIQAASKSK